MRACSPDDLPEACVEPRAKHTILTPSHPTSKLDKSHKNHADYALLLVLQHRNAEAYFSENTRFMVKLGHHIKPDEENDLLFS